MSKKGRLRDRLLLLVDTFSRIQSLHSVPHLVADPLVFLADFKFVVGLFAVQYSEEAGQLGQ